jgi:hypothetical protein
MMWRLIPEAANLLQPAKTSTYSQREVVAMESQTCGKGLAENSEWPATLGALIGALADVLEAHVTALDLTDVKARAERDTYLRLVAAKRKIAGDLQALASEMASAREMAPK